MRESELTQSCPTLRDPMDCSLPGSSIHGIFQARVLEWGAIAFSGVPHELATNQNNSCFEVSSSLILHNNEPFLNWIVTCDEKWIVYNNQQ